MSKAMPKKRKLKKEAILGLIFILVPIVGYLFFNGFNLVISFIVQFCSMDPGDYKLETLRWNNFANFVTVWQNTRFWHSCLMTLLYASSQLVSLTIALIISVLLSKKVRGSKIFEILFFVPYICSSVAVAIMWKWVFSQNGIINSIFNLSIDWLNDTKTLPITILIATIWQAPGYGIVMYKATLAAVNKSLYEAASIDGANGWKTFWHITFPQILPTTFYLLLTGLIAGLMMFDVPKMMAGYDSFSQLAGEGDMGLTTIFYIFIKGRLNDQLNIASVMSWMLFVILFVVSMVSFKLRERSQRA